METPSHWRMKAQRYGLEGLRSARSAAALHGLLKKVRDLGMPLISVSPVEHGEADQSDVE